MRGARSDSNALSGSGQSCCDSVWVGIDMLKYVTSTLATAFCCFVVFHGIAYDLNVADFGGVIPESIIFISSIILLAVNEGFQVGVLNSRSMSAIFIREEGYTRAANVHEVMFGTPDNWLTGNLKRLLIGQSFMVVLCSFTLAQLTTFPHYPNVFGMNDELFNVLFCSGLPGVVLTVVVGQLTPSLLAKEHPLGFLNIPGIYHIVLIALYLEKSGITHFVYVLYGMLNSIFFQVSAAEDDEEHAGLRSRSAENFAVPSLYDLEAYRGRNVDVGISVGLSSSSHESEGRSEGTGGGSEAVSSVTLTSSPHTSFPPNKTISLGNKQAWSVADSVDSVDEHKHTPKKSVFVTPMPSLTRKAEVLSMCSTMVLYLQYVISSVLTLLCLAYLVYGLASRYSLVDLPLALQLVLLFLSMLLILYCEGMKVSIVSTTHIDSEDLKDTHPTAYKVHKLLNVDTSEGVKKFLLGRQLLVVALGFFVATLTHFAGLKGHVPYSLYFVVVTAALPGVMVLLVVAQLTPQLLAEQNNIAFINLPGSYVLARFLLAVESCGLLNVAWLLHYGFDRLLCRGPKNRSHYDDLNTSSSNLFSMCYDSSDEALDESGASSSDVVLSSVRKNPIRRQERGVEC